MPIILYLHNNGASYAHRCVCIYTACGKYHYFIVVFFGLPIILLLFIYQLFYLILFTMNESIFDYARFSLCIQFSEKITCLQLFRGVFNDLVL